VVEPAGDELPASFGAGVAFPSLLDPDSELDEPASDVPTGLLPADPGAGARESLR